MPQYGLPTSDVEKTNWSQGAGDGNANAFEELDEGFGAGRGSGSGPDDATTYWLTTSDLPRLQEGIASVTDPGVTTGHIARMRSRKSASAGQQQDHTLEFGSNLAQQRYGSTVFTNVDNVWTTRTHTWDGATGAPFVYNTVRLGIVVDEVGGGPGREGQISAFELEVPDAASGALTLQSVAGVASLSNVVVGTPKLNLDSVAGVASLPNVVVGTPKLNLDAVAGVASLSNLEVATPAVLALGAIAGVAFLSNLEVATPANLALQGVAGVGNLPNLSVTAPANVQLDPVAGVGNLPNVEVGTPRLNLQPVAGVAALPNVGLGSPVNVLLDAVAGVAFLQNIVIDTPAGEQALLRRPATLPTWKVD